MITRFNAAVAKGRDEREKGFTLIELLVVVIIIGILAAIAIPVFLNQRESAWKSSVESDLKNAATVIETFGAENNGSFATLTDGAWSNIGGSPTTTVIGTGTTLVYKVSDGNTITVLRTGTPTGTSYTITGTNANLATGTNIVYNSADGGLGDWS